MLYWPLTYCRHYIGHSLLPVSHAADSVLLPLITAHACTRACVVVSSDGACLGKCAVLDGTQRVSRLVQDYHMRCWWTEALDSDSESVSL